MIKNKLTVIFTLVLFLLVTAAEGKEYRPGGSGFSEAWDKFYSSDHEPEHKIPLIKAGKKMTLVICDAIKNKDMNSRRYAIGALGYIGDKRALPTLEEILNTPNEIFYFRGDALISIYRIDKELGKKYLKKYGHENEHFKLIKDMIENNPKWISRKISY